MTSRHVASRFCSARRSTGRRRRRRRRRARERTRRAEGLEMQIRGEGESRERSLEKEGEKGWWRHLPPFLSDEIKVGLVSFFENYPLPTRRASLRSHDRPPRRSALARFLIKVSTLSPLSSGNNANCNSCPTRSKPG